MAMPDQVKELLGKVESQGARWLLVAVGVVILIRLRLILFAAALPVMAYWHYSNQAEAEEAPTEGEGEAAARPATEATAGGGGDLQDDLDDFGGGGNSGPAAAAPTSKGPAWGAEEDEDDPFLSDLRPSGGEKKAAGPDGGADPYDQSFWGGDGPKPAAAKPAGTKAPVNFADEDDDFGFLPKGTSGGASRPSPAGLGGGGGLDDFDFLGGGGKDMDFLGGLGGGFGGGFGGGDDDFGGGFGGGGGGGKGGKGKGKKFDGGKGKDPMAPREPDPKQIFVANVGDCGEDELRSFFEEVGDVDRLKVLRNPDGGSKGVCFVTFGSVEQAQKALSLHGSSLDGRNLVVRLAHGGNKGEKGEGKGGFGKDRPPREEGAVDLGGGARFGNLGGGDRGKGGFGGDRPKGGGKGPRRNERGEMDDLLEDFLVDEEGPLRAGDFDFSARRFLAELRSRDRSDDTERFKEALDMVLKYTQSKDRSSVRKWPAYVFTLLQKFDSSLWEEMRERDADRKREKGGGGFGDREGGGGGFRGGGGGGGFRGGGGGFGDRDGGGGDRGRDDDGRLPRDD